MFYVLCSLALALLVIKPNIDIDSNKNKMRRKNLTFKKFFSGHISEKGGYQVTCLYQFPIKNSRAAKMHGKVFFELTQDAIKSCLMNTTSNNNKL